MRLVNTGEVEAIRRLWGVHHRACRICLTGAPCTRGEDLWRLWTVARWELRRGVCSLTGSERRLLLELVAADDGSDHGHSPGVALP